MTDVQASSVDKVQQPDVPGTATTGDTHEPTLKNPFSDPPVKPTEEKLAEVKEPEPLPLVPETSKPADGPVPEANTAAPPTNGTGATSNGIDSKVDAPEPLAPVTSTANDAPIMTGALQEQSNPADNPIASVKSSEADNDDAVKDKGTPATSVAAPATEEKLTPGLNGTESKEDTEMEDAPAPTSENTALGLSGLSQAEKPTESPAAETTEKPAAEAAPVPTSEDAALGQKHTEAPATEATETTEKPATKAALAAVPAAAATGGKRKANQINGAEETTPKKQKKGGVTGAIQKATDSVKKAVKDQKDKSAAKKKQKKELPPPGRTARVTRSQAKSG